MSAAHPVDGDAGPGLHYGTAAGRWALAAAVLGSGIAFLDATVVGIALPAIGREFDAGVDALQWVSNAYTLTLAGLLLLGGTLGDRFGRRRVFVIGVIWFAATILLRLGGQYLLDPAAVGRFAALMIVSAPITSPSPGPPRLRPQAMVPTAMTSETRGPLSPPSRRSM